ncbi:hypothetical protein MHYP_G00148930 [Metynnis hypsauchen]
MDADIQLILRDTRTIEAVSSPTSFHSDPGFCLTVLTVFVAFGDRQAFLPLPSCHC